MTYVGYTQGPDHGLATTLAADDKLANATVVARDQAAVSIALDGNSVYRTTSNCDVNFIADSPQ